MNHGDGAQPPAYVVPTVEEVVVAVRKEMKAIEAANLLEGTDLGPAARGAAIVASGERAEAEARLRKHIADLDRAHANLAKQIGQRNPFGRRR